jgi:2-polyprenyl-6-hydroxyphenyl methylase/3-demethylubiquinone-9 3-methyltransferase
MPLNMSLGSRVRAAFGPWERPLAAAYRACFVNLGHFVDELRKYANPERILEIGCGEGSLTELLAGAFPCATITGIDITPRVGRLFRGDSRRVEFFQVTPGEFAVSHPGSFDLVVICDVIHHVPWSEHPLLLEQSLRALAPGGMLVLKDWERRMNLGHALCYLSDRWITGDRVRYRTAAEFRTLLYSVFSDSCIEREWRVGPWMNNVAFIVKPNGLPRLGIGAGVLSV